MVDIADTIRKEVADQLKPVRQNMIQMAQAVRRMEDSSIKGEKDLAAVMSSIKAVEASLAGFRRETMVLAIKVLAGASAGLGAVVISLVVYIWTNR